MISAREKGEMWVIVGGWAMPKLIQAELFSDEVLRSSPLTKYILLFSV